MWCASRGGLSEEFADILAMRIAYSASAKIIIIAEDILDELIRILR